MFKTFLQSPVLKVSLRYGAIAGVFCVIFLITFFLLGRHPLLINPYMDFRLVLFAVLVFFCLKEIRDFYQEKYLNFLQGLGASFILVAVSAIIAGLGIMIFGMLQPAFLSNYITEFSETIRQLPEDTVKQIGKDVIDSNLKALPATTIGNLASLYVWQSFVMGFFISVIISVILRRQPKPEQPKL